MSQPNPEPAVSDPTGAPAPAAPVPTDPRSATGSGSTEPDVSNPDLKRVSDEAATWRNKLRALEREHEKLKTASLSDTERAIAEAKAAGAAEYQTKWRQALLDNAALTVLAEKRVSAADLALRGLDMSDVDVDTTTGRVDTSSLGRKVDELIARYPMLAPDAPRPGIGAFSGADQRRVQSNELARSGKSDVDALNELARYALGSGD